MNYLIRLFTITGFALAATGSLHADLVLETETAELGEKGDSLISAALQFERDKDGGTAYFTVNQYEYGITSRAEILIEPFFYEWDRPKDGPSYSGVGDLEITPSYMMVLDDPNSWVPAAVAAFKLKVPTATNRDIGTGEFDYQPYIIIGKKIGPWICNWNIGYDFVTSTKTEDLKDQFIYDFSIQRNVTENLGLYAEVFGNTSAVSGENGTFGGAIAAEYKFNENWNVYTSLGYDTDKVMTLRSGFNFEF
ncbi:MAG: transporter [Luteolibacter sp.]|uniref:transporter n=1 Tax=Luteolibacter sp. TaxID=1962973 RepID=UPI00326557D8